MTKRWMALYSTLIIIFGLVACASRQPVVSVTPQKGGETIDIKASDFKFEPNHIKAGRGDKLVIRIENISKTAHNFTLLDPHGNMLQNLDLPPKETVTVNVDLSEPGDYPFHCGKPFHSTFGMHGRIEVE